MTLNNVKKSSIKEFFNVTTIRFRILTSKLLDTSSPLESPSHQLFPKIGSDVKVTKKSEKKVIDKVREK